jgi:alpha-L-rhamnosidase
LEKGLVGNLMVENYRAALTTDFYTMRSGEQIFAPDLTQHGYRYVEIGGLDEALPAECVQRQVLSSVDPSATYTSSNELANKLFTNIVNSTTSNYISIPTDCPQRNERLGWTGDAQIFALSGSYVADTYNFMSQWLKSVRADTAEDGMSPQYSPSYTSYSEGDTKIQHKGQSFGITWNCLAVTIPYNLYMQTGRESIVLENIDNINAYMDTLLNKPYSYKDSDGETYTDERLTGETGSLADHLARVSTNSGLLGNCVFIACLDEAAVLADVVGQTERATLYREKASEARIAWNELFIDSNTGKAQTPDGVIRDTQAAYATPLRFGVISDENMEKFLSNFVESIVSEGRIDSDGAEILPYTITTGFNATGNILNALSDNGLNDIAYRLFESEDYASWLYPITLGATSIWERWNAYTEEGGFNNNNSMNSFNHYSNGAVCEWMMAYQAGITSDITVPGYQQFILQPTIGGDITELEGSYESVYGTIISGWETENGELTSYHTIIPANTVATLYLPTEATDATSLTGVKYVGSGVHNGINVQIYELLAGDFTFNVENGQIMVGNK